MRHVLVRCSLHDENEAREFERKLDSYTSQGYRVLNCGVTNSNLFGWVILQLDDEEERKSEH